MSQGVPQLCRLSSKGQRYLVPLHPSSLDVGRIALGAESQDLPSLPSSPPLVANSKPSQSQVGCQKSLRKTSPAPNPTTNHPDSPLQRPTLPAGTQELKPPSSSSPLLTKPGEGSPSPISSANTQQAPGTKDPGAGGG